MSKEHHMTSKPRKAPRFATAVAMVALIGAGSLSALTHSATPAFASAPMQGGYIDLVERVSPAVVTIEVVKEASPSQAQSRMHGQLPEGFEEFQRRFGLPMPQMPEGGQREARGAGTGFIISDDGRIVTNAHVVDGAADITVKLADGREFDATLEGADTATDIAVIKIDASDITPGLTHVAFGDSKALKVGQNVVAIGNPFGLGNSVTTGIVSALGRDINAGPFDDFIQTDAAINRGNSGGPLFNDQGEVVGMNTAIISPTGGSVGIGFAVPSYMIKSIVTDLTDDGKIDRGWLGVHIQPVSEDVVAALGLDKARGTMIEKVENDTPAAKAGLRKGDIVTAVNGEAVESPRDLTRMIAGDAPGTKVSLTLLRAGKETVVDVTLGHRADRPT
ncbi:Do family serine endopeptidase [Rhodalgimonas zhirmunskyi]|uniref:Do family serine endopeptidase n=1 Tax=Rhodalgimonas zhirmunskyi TaxID=2964767 RepID=A0AAJ1UDV9_9RHOB|nr:Do family serine endopeptidase [Rhodoalgimonas zhirmunskyi]MDQ2095718.1 Do family serine endopeptidase [Rhodoalgimonas zhirmunskyi]